MLPNMSERKQVEQSLRETELHFHQLAEAIQAVFYISDLRRSEILYISPAYEAIWGRTCASLYHNLFSFTESILPDYRAAVLESLQHQRQGTSTEMEYPIQHSDGSTRWIRDRAFPLRDEAGEVYRVIGIAEDITAQKVTTAALSSFVTSCKPDPYSFNATAQTVRA